MFESFEVHLEKRSSLHVDNIDKKYFENFMFILVLNSIEFAKIVYVAIGMSGWRLARTLRVLGLIRKGVDMTGRNSRLYTLVF